MTHVPAHTGAGKRTPASPPADQADTTSDSPALFTIRRRVDLGNDAAGELLAEHLDQAAMVAWLEQHDMSEGTLLVLDERDAQEACGHDMGWAGGAVACECGREACPSNPRSFDLETATLLALEGFVLVDLPL